MTAQLIDGKAIAEAVRREAAVESARLQSLTGQVPTLAAVLVGEDPASQTYVGAKGKACEEAGMGSITHRLPATATQAEVEGLVRALNADPAVSGILVQLPLPKGLNEQAVLDLISLNKDVDGFHPMNIGQLVTKGRRRVHPVYAGRLHRAARPLRHLYRGERRCSRRPQQHCRRAGGGPAAERRCHRDDLPQPDEGSTRQGTPRRHRGSGHRPAGIRARCVAEARLCGDRRRHQPGR